MMFVTERKLRKVIEETLGVEGSGEKKVLGLKKEIDEREKQITSLKKDIGELELKKGLEEKEIKHLVKMREEQQNIEATKKELEMQRKYQEKEMAMQTRFHNDTISLLKEGHDKLQEVYGKIMERLPNVNMHIKRNEEV
ncbi:hypothetical protein FP828_03725 [bacterium]|nr:hypothetical protein [Candidatus Omnitrophota bacterium]MBA3065582.1 hypothetical protein [bacterium]